jgi:hypothetical protein
MIDNEDPGSEPDGESEPPPAPPTVLRVVCECGGALAILELPREETGFLATCPGCGTHYHRSMNDLVRRAEPHATVTVVLPRGRPRG